MSHPRPSHRGPGSTARRVARSGLPLLLAASAAALATAPVASAVEREEIPIVSTSSQTDVVSSTVRIKVPLPTAAGARPAACDWLSYQRFRSADGPTDATQADAVSVLMPGLIEGATAFDPVARNTIREAKRRGKSVEVWGIDRRSNCLEDHTGIDASSAKGDVETMLGYYYGYQPIDGKKFGGFASNAKFLAELGLAQTINDYHAVLVNELPSQPWREKHVICGGHSLGGPLTEAFAAWDFDGDPKTTEDAGYRQCAGFMGFDTGLKGSITTKTASSNALMEAFTGGLLAGTRNVTTAALRAGLAPRYVDITGIGPETMGLLEAIGYLAETRPDEDWSPTVARVPNSRTVKDFMHISGSYDLNRFLFSGDSMRDIRYSYMAALGQIMDDNGAIFGLVRSSFGFFDGAPITPNKLPAALGGVPGLGMFVKPGKLVMPQRKNPKPLVGWANYDEVGTGTGPIGNGWTTPAEEVTDARDFARILHEGPLNLTEGYFPIRLLLETFIVQGGDRSGELRNLRHPDGVTRKPRFVVIAGDGLRGNETTYLDPIVKLPGYQHLDVLTAAERQADGKPEGSSQAFADLIDQAVGG